MTTESVEQNIVAAALSQVGVPYIYGGDTPKGFDCSGLTLWSCAEAGVHGLPHGSIAQWLGAGGPHFTRPQPGDIVYFVGVGGSKTAPAHCAICKTFDVLTNTGTMVQAEETGTVVMISQFSPAWPQYVGCSRPALLWVPKPSDPPFPGRLLKYVVDTPMMRGGDVGQWQQEMLNKGWEIAVDGFYGPHSAGTCRAFQTQWKLGIDGIVGPVTWDATWTKAAI